MLEIIILWMLAARNGRVAKKKGRSKTGFILITIGLWVGCELTGAVIGSSISNGDFGTSLFITVIGAAVGAITSCLIVNNLSPKKHGEINAIGREVDSSYGETEVYDRPLPVEVSQKVA